MLFFFFPEEETSSAGGAQITTGAIAETAVTTSASTTMSCIHSRDPSPMKEYLKGFGKRSTSVDAGMIDGGFSASGSDTWRLFHEIRGKIAKRVEEKLGEIKSDRSSSSVFTGGANVRGGRLGGGGGSIRDDSSINSDSEDISECSSKGQDTRPAKLKERKEDSSPKKTLVFPDTHKKDDNDIALISLETPSISGSQETSINLSAPTTPRKSNRVTASGTFSVLRKRKSDKVLMTADSDDAVLDGTQPFIEEVESGVEVNEEMNLNIIEPDDSNIPTTDYRQPFPVTFPPLKPERRQKKSLILRLRYWGIRLLPLILVYFMISLPPYITGFLNGIAVSIVVGAVYAWIVRLSKPAKSRDSDESCLQIDKKFSIPDYTKMPILEIPAAKEYHQVNKYQVGHLCL